MKTIIIEDEKAAVRNLKALLSELDFDVEVLVSLDSITDSIEWFHTNLMPDLVFLDIHLADGSAFEIFRYVEITCPIIFTTAYDEYALQAFKVNSIEYLLKPIGASDIEKAFLKMQQLQGIDKTSENNVHNLLNTLKQKANYKTHFLIPAKGDKLIPLVVNDIAYFYISNGLVKGVLVSNKEYIMPQTLDELAESLDPSSFFRVNRQFLVAKNAIQDIDLWFSGRLSINLYLSSKEKILVSKARVAEFKEWFSGGK